MKPRTRYVLDFLSIIRNCIFIGIGLEAVGLYLDIAGSGNSSLPWPLGIIALIGFWPTWTYAVWKWPQTDSWWLLAYPVLLWGIVGVPLAFWVLRRKKA